MRKFTSSMLLAVVFVAVLVLAGAVASAEDNTIALPWDGLEIQWGNVLLVWAGIQSAIVSLLKSIKINGQPWLATKWQKRWANAAIGFIGLVLASVTGGIPILQALGSAIAVTFGSTGFWEYIGEALQALLGKRESASGATGT